MNIQNIENREAEEKLNLKIFSAKIEGYYNTEALLSF
jgi:hypothetical protein